MLRTMWKKILSLFNKEYSGDNIENSENERYTNSYEDEKDINFTTIFSNKLANYVVNDSNFDLIGNDKRTLTLQKVLNKLGIKLKRVVSRSLGTGGCLVIPYVNSKKIYFDIVRK